MRSAARSSSSQRRRRRIAASWSTSAGSIPLTRTGTSTHATTRRSFAPRSRLTGAEIGGGTMRRAIVLAAILGGGGLSMAAAGLQDPNAPKIVKMQTLNVRDILYVLTGGGGNTLALMRDDGVVLIDTKLP